VSLHINAPKCHHLSPTPHSSAGELSGIVVNFDRLREVGNYITRGTVHWAQVGDSILSTLAPDCRLPHRIDIAYDPVGCLTLLELLPSQIHSYSSAFPSHRGASRQEPISYILRSLFSFKCLRIVALSRCRRRTRQQWVAKARHSRFTGLKIHQELLITVRSLWQLHQTPKQGRRSSLGRGPSGRSCEV